MESGESPFYYLSFLAILSLSVLSLPVSVCLRPCPAGVRIIGRQCTSHQTVSTGNGTDGWIERWVGGFVGVGGERKQLQGQSHLVLL